MQQRFDGFYLGLEIVRLVIASDTHMHHDRLHVPNGDVFVHCGDFTEAGSEADVIDFAAWLRSLPHRHLVVIAGNHDFLFEYEPDVARELLGSIGSRLAYLEDSGVTIDGHRFWGSPWQPRFYDWAFNLDRGEAIAEKWALIPHGTDVLITHGPSAGILDRVGFEDVGCADLRERVIELQPAVHAFGHIHERSGTVQIGGTTYVNASICDEHYSPVNPCQVVDI